MLALLRLAENPRDRVAGFRVMQLLPGVGPASAQRVLDRMADSSDPIAALAAIAGAAARGRDWIGFVATLSTSSVGQGRLAGRNRTRAPLV